jgi:hypothetical protein
MWTAEAFLDAMGQCSADTEEWRLETELLRTDIEKF